MTQAVQTAQPLPFSEKQESGPSAAKAAAPARLTSRTIRDSVLTDIRQLAAAVLVTPPERLEDTTNLADYGFDSIHLANLSRQLTDHLGVEITPVVFFSYPRSRSCVAICSPSMPLILPSIIARRLAQTM